MPKYLVGEVQMDDALLQAKMNMLCNDPETRLEVHTLFAKMIDPWVPFLNGPLSQTLNIQPEYVQYTQPYAHYQYYGVKFKHTKDYHPLASAMWDDAAMVTIGDSFVQQVKDILVRRAKQ